LETPIKVSDTVARVGFILFSTPFSVEIVNASRHGKVNMPTMDLYNGTLILRST